jgi:anti-sigma B factor antagonist
MQPFSSTTEVKDGVAKVVLAGEIDAGAAPAFRAEIEKVAAQNPRRLALLMQDVSYMASAGLRVLIFAKQRLGTDVDIFVVGAQEPVLETLRTTGFHYSCVLLDSYDARQIEGVASR